MTMKTSLKPAVAAVGFALVGSLAVANLANAADNPFGTSSMKGGYIQLAEADKAKQEGMSGMGGMSGDKAKQSGMSGMSGDKAKQEGMSGMGGMSGDKAKKEGKCGEGKCGGAKKPGEGKCGGAK
jgi:uncharacterized low-complexity protein